MLPVKKHRASAVFCYRLIFMFLQLLCDAVEYVQRMYNQNHIT
ncbi:MAG: hypothetical protein RL226_2206 [Bacteroidota bacterium]